MEYPFHCSHCSLGIKRRKTFIEHEYNYTCQSNVYKQKKARWTRECGTALASFDVSNSDERSEESEEKPSDIPDATSTEQFGNRYVPHSLLKWAAHSRVSLSSLADLIDVLNESKEPLPKSLYHLRKK
jgi:hypothetical protein